MGVLVDGGLCGGDSRVDVDGVLMHEAIDCAVLVLEEHRLTLLNGLLHLLIDGHRVHHCSVIFQTREVDLLRMRSPLLAVLIHKIGDNLVVEGRHAVNTDTQVITCIDTAVTRQDLLG